MREAHGKGYTRAKWPLPEAAPAVVRRFSVRSSFTPGLRGGGCVLKSESFCFDARTTSANHLVPVKAVCCPCRHSVEPGPVFQPAGVGLGVLDSDPTHLDPGVLSGGASLVARWTPRGPSGRVWLVSVCFPQARFCSPTSQALLLTRWVHFAE